MQLLVIRHSHISHAEARHADLSGQSSGVCGDGRSKRGVCGSGCSLCIKPSPGYAFKKAHHGGLQLPAVFLEVCLNPY